MNSMALAMPLLLFICLFIFFAAFGCWILLLLFIEFICVFRCVKRYFCFIITHALVRIITLGLIKYLIFCEIVILDFAFNSKQSKNCFQNHVPNCG